MLAAVSPGSVEDLHHSSLFCAGFSCQHPELGVAGVAASDIS